MASSSNPPTGPAMASDDDSQNPMADAEATAVVAIDGESIDPLDFLLCLKMTEKTSFSLSLIPGEEVTADRVWVPPLSTISDLKIQRGDMQPVPIDFEFPCSASADWYHWVADEFLDADFCNLLEQVGVAEAILLSRSCNMYRDIEMLRQILRWWCTSTHTFFLSWGEFTITLEDVENHWMLPGLSDVDPSTIEMSEKEMEVEQALMSRSNTRTNAWSLHFAKGTDDAICRAAFVAYWLYKCIFGETPYYAMKPVYFRLAVKISFGHRLPLAAMFLGHLYLQLDSICADEIRGGSCHFITTCLNSSALQTFLWEHSLNYQEVGNDNSQIREKFRNMSRHILSRYPDLRVNLPLAYRWVGLRVKDLDLVPSFDFEECVVWRPYSYRYTGFSCHSVLYWFSDIASQSFELLPDDTKSLTYLSAVNPGWLPTWGSKGVEFTHYCANKVRRQFGLDQGVPGSPNEILPRVPSVAPFLTDQAFGYWSQSISHMVIPYGGRLGIYTVAMQEYWLKVAAAMADYIGQGRGTKIPLSDHHAIKFPPGWKESVKVVEERQKLDFKRGKGSKRIDSGRGDSTPAKQKSKYAAKTPSRRPKVAMDRSIIPPSELAGRSPVAPGTSKKSAAESSKSRKKPEVGSPEGSAVDPSIAVKEVAPSAVQEKSTPPPVKVVSESPGKSVAPPKKAKGKTVGKSATLASSPERESLVGPAITIKEGSAVSVEEESAIPVPPGTMYNRTRSKRKAAAERAKSKVGDEVEGFGWTPIVIEVEVSGDNDVIDTGIEMTEVGEDVAEGQEVMLETAGDVITTDIPIGEGDSGGIMADETLGTVVSDEDILVMADDAAHETTSVMADEVSDEIHVGTADVTHADTLLEIVPVMAGEDSHDQDVSSVDSEETTLDEPQLLQVIPFADQRGEPPVIDPVRLRMDHPLAKMTSVIEGVSLFGTVPHFVRVLREEGSPVMLSTHSLSEAPIDSQVHALEGVPTQDVDGDGMADTEVHGVESIPAGAISLADEMSATASSSQTRSAVEIITPGEVAAFFERFEERALNPYPDWHFWRFEGPLVAYGSFWVYQDAVPLLQRLSAKFGDFTAHFKFGAGSIAQDLIAVGFDLGFLLEHLQKVARELMSAVAASPEVSEVASPIDGLFD
uniref:Aminotransferase-like plant mobile domain-containing protein n=1 Tax=Fagus sylvatica TaxID=28930 RepID=A0A2N9J1V2_FAGSY